VVRTLFVSFISSVLIIPEAQGQAEEAEAPRAKKR
jgi:hypothetical protein